MFRGVRPGAEPVTARVPCRARPVLVSGSPPPKPRASNAAGATWGRRGRTSRRGQSDRLCPRYGSSSSGSTGAFGPRTRRGSSPRPPVGVGARVDQGHAGAPFDVVREHRAEFGVRRETDLVRRVHQQVHPAAALSFGDAAAQVLGGHVLVAAVVGRVLRRAAEDLRQPDGDVLGVLRVHAREDRGQDLVLQGVRVEGVGEAVHRLRSAHPLVDGGGGTGCGAHDWGAAFPGPATSVTR